MAQPIQAVQIYYEHPFGAEREVLREFFSFVGCLVKTTMMPVETMLEKHKSLANPESEQITHLFLTDRPPEGIVLSKNEMWCSFRILKRELTINGKAILHNVDQKISAEQFEKTALDVIIRRIWKNDEAETQSLLYINAAFWQFDLFAFLQIKNTFQALKMGELMALPMRGHYYLPEAVYLNKTANAFINMAKQCSVGPSSIYAVYAYANAQRHLRELLASLEAHTQSNYTRSPYKVEMVDSQKEFSYKDIYNRYMELENIDFECTLREYHNKTKCAFVPQELYYRVKLRDNYKCQHCGRQIRDSQKVYIDHVIPISKGGKNIPSNLQVLCEMCNKRKHSP